MTGRRLPAKWLLREPLNPPAWEQLDHACRALFEQADQAIRACAAAAGALPDAGLIRPLPPPLQRWPGIHHPLTVKFPPITNPIDLGRSRTERRAAIAVADTLQAAQDDLGMDEFVRNAARHLTGSERFRTAPIATDPDPMGRHIVFPGPEHIPSQFARIDDFLTRSAGAADSFRAIVTAVMLVNCHALPDGNGRVARVAFNLLAHPHAGPSRFYLPLYEIGMFSRGGYIIRLRQAELKGEWQPMAAFVLAAARLWHSRLMFLSKTLQGSDSSSNARGKQIPGARPAACDFLG